MPTTPPDPPSTLRSPSRSFAERHLGPDARRRSPRCSDVVGHASLDSLMAAAIPESIHDHRAARAAPGPHRARGARRRSPSIAGRNQVVTSLIGAGYHGTHTPAVIARNIFENPAWYTAYTPYQPEISQGRLEALLNFQTVVTDLTGMDIANASLLDEATAAAEAMTLARRQSKVAGDTFFVDADCHPQVIEVVQTRAEPLGTRSSSSVTRWSDLDGPRAVRRAARPPRAAPARSATCAPWPHGPRGAGAVVCVATDLLALTLLTPPGEWGADVVVGSAQRFGVPLGFGGPHAGFMAVRESARRSLPGRLVGVSVDAHGRRALRLALQTREQHIRREKATSNICTAQVLLAVMAGAYATYHGPDGLTRIARRTHGLAVAAAEALRAGGSTSLASARVRHRHRARPRRAPTR